jgi:hypothetical protein
LLVRAITIGCYKRMGGGREGDHPPKRPRAVAKRVCTTSAQREAEDRGDPAAGAHPRALSFPARGAEPLRETKNPERRQRSPYRLR